MANSFSLTTQGANPLASPTRSSTYAKNVSGIISTPSVANTNTSGLVDDGNTKAIAPTQKQVIPGLLPTTPVKSIATSDGTTTTFHAPVTETPSKSATPSVSSDNANSAPVVGVSSPSKLQSSGILPNGGYSTIPGLYDPTNGKLKSGEVPQAQPNSTQTAIQGVKDASGITPEEQYYNNMAISAKELSNHNALDPYAEQGFYNGTNGAQLGVSLNAPDLQGRASGEAGLSSGVGNIFGSAASTGYANALQQQQLQLGGAENVLSASQPVTQFGQLTDPLTGKVIGAGVSGNNPALDTAVENAIKMVQSGSSITDAQASLAGYGQAGVNAFNQAQVALNNGTYNPTATNAQVQQNIAQGQQYQGQATVVDTALKSVDAFSQAAINQLKQSGYNPSDTAIYNQPIDKYISSLGNTEAAKQVALYMGDIQKYTGQILATNSGTIPTDVSNTLANIDPSTLNGAQLQNYLETVKYLGTTQKNVLQQQANASYGQEGGYAGSTDAAVPASVSAPNTTSGSGITSTSGQLAAGVGLNTATDLEKIVSTGSNILSFILGKVGL